MSNTGPSFDTKPTILIFSTSGLHGDFKKLSDQAHLRQATFEKPDDASKLLEAHTSARAIWIVDPEITITNYAALSRQVYEYVCQGGIAVLGGLFGSIATTDHFDTWMQKEWGLPWRIGQYETTTVCLQQHARGLDFRGEAWKHGLPQAYSSKASFLKGVKSKDVWYAAPPGARSENVVSLGQPVAAETSAAFTKVGSGWLGYTGDVNTREPITRVEMAMMGLFIGDL